MLHFPVAESLVWAVRYDFQDYDDLAKNNQSLCERCNPCIASFRRPHPTKPENLIKIYTFWFVLSCTCHNGDLSLEIVSLRDSNFLEAKTEMQVADTTHVLEQVHNESKRALEIQLSWYCSRSGFYVLKYFVILKPSLLRQTSFHFHLFLKCTFHSCKKKL